MKANPEKHLLSLNVCSVKLQYPKSILFWQCSNYIQYNWNIAQNNFGTAIKIWRKYYQSL